MKFPWILVSPWNMYFIDILFVDTNPATIPGRPALHERSASAPAEEGSSRVKGYRQSSYKQLAPLIIPQLASKAPQFLQHRFITHTRSGSVPNPGPRAFKIADSPSTRTQYTPSASMTDLQPSSAPNTNAIFSNTMLPPRSASALEFHRFSPRTPEGRSATPTMTGRSETPQPTLNQRAATPPGNQKAAAEPSRIMDRGRPRMRADEPRKGGSAKNGESSRSLAAERKAFEELPSGWRPKDVASSLSTEEISSLYQQAHKQAEHFEVLKPADVEMLSKVCAINHNQRKTSWHRY